MAAAEAAVTGGLPDRATAMLARTVAEAAAVLDATGAAQVRRAVQAALCVRAARFDADDARSLASARTVRILVADGGVRDPDALCAAAFVDSIDGIAAPAGVLADDAVRLLMAVPLPDASGDRLLEELVSAPSCAGVIAVAERLDQARHLHLRPDLPWVAFHAGIREVYIPAALRLRPPLARRLDRWADAFARRLLLPD